MTDDDLIVIKGLKTYLGQQWIHKDVNLTVKKGEILGIVGGSGTGKTVLIREMLGLLHPYAGSIQIFGHEMTTASPATMLSIQKQWGVLFQQNALFSSLSVLENVLFPLKEHTDLDIDTMQALALLKIQMAGLPIDSSVKFPSELSGGMQKRAGIARAIALDPALIFLDEPTAGLDPNTAAAFDDLILNLQSTMGLTMVMVTHDLDSLWRVTNRVAFLGEGKVLNVCPMAQLVNDAHPLIQAFFSGQRGRIATSTYDGKKEN